MKRVLAALVLLLAVPAAAGLPPAPAPHAAGDGPDRIVAECSRRAKADGVALESMHGYLRDCIRALRADAAEPGHPSHDQPR